jgi:hypothetical protein
MIGVAASGKTPGEYDTPEQYTLTRLGYMRILPSFQTLQVLGDLFLTRYHPQSIICHASYQTVKCLYTPVRDS